MRVRFKTRADYKRVLSMLLSAGFEVLDLARKVGTQPDPELYRGYWSPDDQQRQPPQSVIPSVHLLHGNLSTVLVRHIDMNVFAQVRELHPDGLPGFWKHFSQYREHYALLLEQDLKEESIEFMSRFLDEAVALAGGEPRAARRLREILGHERLAIPLEVEDYRNDLNHPMSIARNVPLLWEDLHRNAHRLNVPVIDYWRQHYLWRSVFARTDQVLREYGPDAGHYDRNEVCPHCGYPQRLSQHIQACAWWTHERKRAEVLFRKFERVPAPHDKESIQKNWGPYWQRTEYPLSSDSVPAKALKNWAPPPGCLSVKIPMPNQVPPSNKSGWSYTTWYYMRPGLYTHYKALEKRLGPQRAREFWVSLHLAKKLRQGGYLAQALKDKYYQPWRALRDIAPVLYQKIPVLPAGPP